jgi:hypothetical protein
MTVAIVRLSPLAIVAGPWPGIPSRIEAGGWRIDAAPIGASDNGTLRLVDVVYSGAQPTQFHSLASESLALNTNTLTITQTWSPPTLAAVKAALRARLDREATSWWLEKRGVGEANLESALSTGITNINAAANIAAAINAYQAVVFE